MSVEFKKPGILTTVQDLGRYGLREFGINTNGAMDRCAVRLINALLGNAENAPVLEMHFPAAEIYFEEAAAFALGGADFSPHLDDEPLENWRIYYAAQGTTLKFADRTFGNRAYLSIRGGFKIEPQLGSASTNLKAKFGGIDGRKFTKGDRLFFQRQAVLNTKDSNFKISAALLPFYSRFPTVRIIAGSEYDELTAISQQNFLKHDYLISPASDRMGFRLTGEPLYLLDAREMISSAVNFGTIQLLPDGQMIVLMADHQTTGGYPRIGNVVPTDLPLLAQLGAHDRVAFHLISLAEAEKLLIQFERNLNLLKTAVRFL